jgi:hypothetical protein
VDTVIGVLVSVLVLVVFTWVAIFGGVGALLSRARGGSTVSGLAWGIVLGPIGWLVTIWTTRGGSGAIEVPAPTVLAKPTSQPGPRPASDQWDPWNK